MTVLSYSLASMLLPPQFFMEENCQVSPYDTFSDLGCIVFSKLLSTEDTMVHYIKEVIAPYIQEVKDSLGLPKNYSAIAILQHMAAVRY